ncbi:MAG: carboxypeptidase-like regulatory domain-containing protein, partial [Bacteroidota bacterium]
TIAGLVVWDTYSVTVTNNDLGCTGQAVAFVNGQDSLNFIEFPDPFVIGCAEDSVYVEPAEILEGYTYTWYGPLNQIIDGPGFWAVMPGTYFLEAFNEQDCGLSGRAEVVSANLNPELIDIFVFGNDSICASHNCIFLTIGDNPTGSFPEGIEITWETPNELADSIANNNPFGTLCTPIPGLYRATITTACDTVVRDVFLEDPLGCSSLSGYLWADQAADCDLDGEDTPVPNFILLLTNDATGEMYYVMTDAEGYWQAELPVGTYTIEPSVPVGSPFGACDPATSAVLGEFPVTGVNVFLPATSSCPQLSTAVTMPFLRRCFSNLAWVEYTNSGSATAENAQLTVTLDDFFVDVQANPAPSAQDGNTYTFDLGDLPPFAAGFISFRFTISCEADLGQSHCIDASITPDEPCNPDAAWEGALVAVDAVGCNGDSVLFQITNIGEEQMSVPLNYVIVEDGIMLNTVVNGLLIPNEVMEIYLPANGSTYHLMTNQEPNAPADPAPTAVLEGCSSSPNNDVT